MIRPVMEVAKTSQIHPVTKYLELVRIFAYVSDVEFWCIRRNVYCTYGIDDIHLQGVLFASWAFPER